MKIKTLLFVLLISNLSLYAQSLDFSQKTYDTYENYREQRLNHRRFKHEDLQPLIQEIKSNALFEVQQVGTSVQGRSISMISVGKGKTDVLLWSQMHGDEPTATQAIFDILNYLKAKIQQDEVKQIFKKLRLHFIPMLNPDGAQVYQRRNALGVDLNRDALRLQSPESKVLKKMRDSLNADFGFNLHDQSTYYNAERTASPATISYLATAYNYEKEINKTRAKSMKVISFMNQIIQKYAPGQVGRYNDDFEPRAFGDNIQKWGTSLILIESGGYQNDIEKQYIRKLNFVSILAALHTIADKSYSKIDVKTYDNIPMNDRKLFDLKLEKVGYDFKGKNYHLDLGIQRFEVNTPDYKDYYNKSQLVDIGDLSTFFGYENFDASTYTIRPGKIYKAAPDFYPTSSEAISLLKQGYLYLQSDLEIDNDKIDIPMIVVSRRYQERLFDLHIGLNPSFLLEKEGIITHAVVNGFLIDLEKGVPDNFKNGLFIN